MSDSLSATMSVYSARFRGVRLENKVKVVQITPFDNGKLHCLKEFTEGVISQEVKPDSLVFVLDSKGSYPLGSYLTAWAQRFFEPLMEVLFIQSDPCGEDKLDKIGAARNEGLKMARGMGADYVWWVDGDIKPSPRALMRLLSCGSGVFGGLVATRELPYVGGEFKPRPSRMNVYTADASNGGYTPAHEVPLGCVVDVTTTGNDCLLMSKDVFLEQDYRWSTVDPKMGEDFAYCLDAGERGFRVAVHTGVVCEHFSPIEVFSTKNGYAERYWRFS